MHSKKKNNINTRILKASSRDIQEIVKICRNSFPYSIQWQAPYFLIKKKFNSFIESEFSELYVLKSEENVLGFAILISDEIKFTIQNNDTKITRIIAIIVKPWLFFLYLYKKYIISNITPKNTYKIHTGIKIKPQERTWLELIAISSAYRRYGLGNLFLKFLEKRTRELKKQFLQLSVNFENEGAQNLYLSRNYKIININNKKYSLVKSLKL